MNDEFEFAKRSYSASDIQYYFKYIWKKHKIKTKNPPIYVYTNRIINRLVLNKKDRYKLELQMPETMKLFGSTKKLIHKTNNGGNVPRLEVVEVILVHCNLVDSQYELKSGVL